MAASHGTPAATNRSLTDQTADVWLIMFAIGDHPLPEAELLASPDEICTASRLRFNADRVRYIHSHAALRAVLSRYVTEHPRAHQFRATSFGKPYLVSQDQTAKQLMFNLSHSGNCAMIAVSTTCDVGVDIEEEREVQDLTSFADSVTTKAESERLGEIGLPCKSAAFLRMWTLKESILKATGYGMAIEPSEIAVLEHLSEPDATLLAPGRHPLIPASLRAMSLDAQTGYVAAVAFTDRISEVRVHCATLASLVMSSGGLQRTLPV